MRRRYQALRPARGSADGISRLTPVFTVAVAAVSLMRHAQHNLADVATSEHVFDSIDSRANARERLRLVHQRYELTVRVVFIQAVALSRKDARGERVCRIGRRCSWTPSSVLGAGSMNSSMVQL